MEKRLCSLRDQVVAGMIEDLLRQSGLHPRPLGISGTGFLAGEWYDLWVPEEEEEKAIEVLTAKGYQKSLVRQ